MAYLVELTTRAGRDLEAIFEEIHAGETPAATRWFDRLERAILTLESFPHSYPRAIEAAATRRPLRHLLYGKKPHVYRVIFEVDEGSKIVRVLTVRHGARDQARSADLR